MTGEMQLTADQPDQPDHSPWRAVYDLTGRVDEVLALFADTHWAAWRTGEDVAFMLQHSIVAVGLAPASGGPLVGFARVLGDGRFKAIVEDVVVAADRRGQGIGTVLLDALLDHPLVAQVEEVELYCHPDRARFYRDAGFAVVDDQLFMRCPGRAFTGSW